MRDGAICFALLCASFAVLGVKPFHGCLSQLPFSAVVGVFMQCKLLRTVLSPTTYYENAENAMKAKRERKDHDGATGFAHLCASFAPSAVAF